MNLFQDKGLFLPEPAPSHVTLLTTRELVVELTKRIQDRFGTDMVHPRQWQELTAAASELHALQQSQPLVWPDIEEINANH